MYWAFSLSINPRSTMSTFSVALRTLFSSLRPTTLFLSFVLLTAGCTNSAPTSNSSRALDLARQALPKVQTVPHHPDSLVHVRLSETEAGPTVHLVSGVDRSTSQNEWTASAGFTSIDRSEGWVSGPSDDPADFATLVSLESKLAPLAGSSPADGAVAERLRAYRATVPLKFCFFDSDRDTDVPDALLWNDRGDERRAVEVKMLTSGLFDKSVAGERRPFESRMSQGREEDAFTPYRCFVATFERSQDGTDILDGARWLTLKASLDGMSGKRGAFHWRFPTEDGSVAQR